MGVKIAMTDILPFFQKCAPQIEGAVKELEQKGVEIKVAFFVVQFLKDGKLLAACPLPVSSANLMKDKANHGVKTLVEKGLTSAVISVQNQLNPGQSEEVVKYEAKEFFNWQGKKYGPGQEVILPKGFDPSGLPVKLKQEAPEIEEAVGVILPQKKKKPLAGKVHLRDADALLQKVHGTDQSSTYYTVALSDRVNVAARIKKKTLSLRLEGKLSKEDEVRASTAGFQKASAGHMSMHVDCQQVPPVAVIGGMLFRLGVSFQQIVTNEAEIPVEN